MKAQEMFEELGYGYFERNNCIHYEWEDESKTHWANICFNLDYKLVFACQDYDPMQIDMPTFKAIQKQIEELRW